MSGQPVRALAALRYRDFALLWSGQAVSVIGDGIFTVALALAALRLSGGAVGLALVLAARSLPNVVFALVGGVVVDRLPRRLVLLASDSVRGLVVGAVAAFDATGLLRLWQLVVMSVAFGVADAFFFPASTAVVPELVPEEALVSASALTSTTQSVAGSLVGPAFGGVLVAVIGTGWAFGLNAVSFGVSAGCLLAMRTRPGRARPSEGNMLASIREGVGYCRSQKWLWWSLLAAGAANFLCFSPLGVLEPLLVRRVFHAGAVALGIVFAAGGAGGMLASLAVARLGAPRRKITAMWIGWSAAGLATLGLAWAPDVWAAAFFAGGVWGALAYGNVLWFPLMQQQVPADLLGRASSVDALISFALSPLGMLFGGLLAAAVGTRLTLAIGGGLAACTIGVLFVPGVREIEQRRIVQPQVQAGG
ncbi:MAG: MFS transporter [Mycobacteriales bacterium]